jgi:3-oxoacyl-[acyl-carrier-protein] synthase II
MTRALRQAGVAAEEVGYVNAHGTATAANDVAESLAIRQVFGGRAGAVAVSSTKPVTGHLLGAAGALETVIATLALGAGVVPTTLNFERGAPGCDLDYVAGGSREARGVRVALNLSCGFGGVNSCLVIGRAG